MLIGRKSMGRKGRFKGRVWEGKEDFTEDNGKERKVLRKIMGRKGRFEGKVWEGKEGFTENNGKERKV